MANKAFTEDELFTMYPELGDIAIRLGHSESDASNFNTNQDEDDILYEKKKPKKNPDYFCISHIYVGGTELKLYGKETCGKDAFIEEATRIIDSRSPDALIVKLWNGKPKSKGQAPAETPIIPITSKGQAYMMDQQTRQSNSTKGLGQVEQARQRMEEYSRRPNLEKSDTDYTLLKRDFDDKLKDYEHRNALDKLKAHYEAEIKELQDTIDDLEAEIEDLSADITERDGALGSLSSEMEKQKDPPAVDILAKVATKALTGVLQTQPKLTAALTGLTEEELREIWVQQQHQLPAPEQIGNAAASFEDATETGFEGKDEKHIGMIQDIYGFCKLLSWDEFRMVYRVFAAMQETPTAINKPMMIKFLGLIHQYTSSDTTPQEQA